MRALLALACLLVPLASQSQEICARAQGIIAQTSLAPAVNVHDTWDAFVESKPGDQPFEVEQFFSSHRPGSDEQPTVVSCKMRTAERINTSHYDDGSDTPPAGTESSCDAVHRAFLEEVYRQVPDEQQKIALDRWQVMEEELTYIGPKWLQPWPFVPVVRRDDGRLQLHTRALYVPYAWWIPMPDRFLGNYYCHLVAPDYLRALVTGASVIE